MHPYGTPPIHHNPPSPQINNNATADIKALLFGNSTPTAHNHHLLQHQMQFQQQQHQLHLQQLHGNVNPNIRMMIPSDGNNTHPMAPPTNNYPLLNTPPQLHSPINSPIILSNNNIVNNNAEDKNKKAATTTTTTTGSSNKKNKHSEVGFRITTREYVHNDNNNGVNNNNIVELEATAITLYSSELEYVNGKYISVNNEFICYVVRGDMIRVLQRKTGSRGLIKGHTAIINDISFSTDSYSNLISSVGKDGNFYIWKLIDNNNNNTISNELQLRVIFNNENKDNDNIQRCIFHQVNSNVIATVNTTRNIVNIWDLNTINNNDKTIVYNNNVEDSYNIGILKFDTNRKIQDISFLGDFNNKICVAFEDTIEVWQYDINNNNNNKCNTIITPFKTNKTSQTIKIQSINNVPKNNSVNKEGGDFLVIGGNNNSLIELWEMKNKQCLQTIDFSNNDNDLKYHIAIEKTGRFVYISNEENKTLYVLHLHIHYTTPSLTIFDYISQFLINPVLSFTVIQVEPTNDNNEDNSKNNEEEIINQIYCVHPKAVQLYTINFNQTYNYKYLDDYSYINNLQSLHTSEESIEQLNQTAQTEQAASFDTEIGKGEPTEQLEEQVEQVEQKEQKEQINNSIEESIKPNEEVEIKDTNKDNEEEVNTNTDTISSTINTAFNQDESQDELLTPESFKVHINSPSVLPQQPNVQYEFTDINNQNNKKETDFNNNEETKKNTPKNKNRGSNKKTRSSETTPTVPVNNNSFIQSNKENQTNEYNDNSNNNIRQIENVIKQQMEQLYNKLEGERIEREKVERERQERLLIVISQTLNTNLTQQLESTIHNELQTIIVPTLAKTLIQTLENNLLKPLQENFKKIMLQSFAPKIDSIIKESFTKAVSNKQVSSELAKSLASNLRSPVEEAFLLHFQDTLIPAFENSCNTMVKQLYNHINSNSSSSLDSRKLESVTNQLKLATESFSDISNNLTRSLIDNQNKVLVEFLDRVQRNQDIGFNSSENKQQPITKVNSSETANKTTLSKLQKLIQENKVEEAFSLALSARNIDLLVSLCSKIEPTTFFSAVNIPISQHVLLSLIQQLGFDITKDTLQKLTWLKEAILVLNINDKMINEHSPQVLSKLLHNLKEHYPQYINSNVGSLFKIVIHIINSLLK